MNNQFERDTKTDKQNLYYYNILIDNKALILQLSFSFYVYILFNF